MAGVSFGRSRGQEEPEDAEGEHWGGEAEADADSWHVAAEEAERAVSEAEAEAAAREKGRPGAGRCSNVPQRWKNNYREDLSRGSGSVRLKFTSTSQGRYCGLAELASVGQAILG
jgi:hypothetical protein